MVEPQRKRMFTAELKRKRAVAPAPPEASLAEEGEQLAAARHRAILAAIAELRGALAAVAPAHAREHGQPGEAGGDPCIDDLRQEVGKLAQAIEDTKREIAALRRREAPADRLVRATNELDAVVQATETATVLILSAAEEINDIVGAMSRGSSDPGEIASLAAVREHIVRIFEACNFQDITGQRISKVVATVKFIEQRVERLIEILGGAEAFFRVEAPEEAAAANPDAHLLHGPALDGDHKITQADIDKLFD
jgi:chemotaxis protein CheZ